MYSQLPVKEVYKMMLLKRITLLDRQIRKANLEIEILAHQLEVSAWSQVNYVNYWNSN